MRLLYLVPLAGLMALGACQDDKKSNAKTEVPPAAPAPAPAPAPPAGNAAPGAPAAPQPPKPN